MMEIENVENFKYPFAIEINQSSWLHDSSDESENDTDVDNYPESSVLSSEEPTILSAEEMDRQSEEIMHDLRKANIIFEPVMNGSMFPAPTKTATKPSKAVSNKSSSENSEIAPMNELKFKSPIPFQTTSSADLNERSSKESELTPKNEPKFKPRQGKKSFRTSTLAVKEDEWRPMTTTKPFSVNLEEFPAL